MAGTGQLAWGLWVWCRRVPALLLPCSLSWAILLSGRASSEGSRAHSGANAPHALCWGPRLAPLLPPGCLAVPPGVISGSAPGAVSLGLGAAGKHPLPGP